MAEAHGTPHYHNQPGLPQIRVRAKNFMCIGALPPFDHPHVFIAMGDDDDTVCEYCSTHFIYDPKLPALCEPAACLFMPDAEDSRSERRIDARARAEAPVPDFFPFENCVSPPQAGDAGTSVGGQARHDGDGNEPRIRDSSI